MRQTRVGAVFVVVALGVAAVAFFGLHRGLGPPGETQKPPARVGEFAPQAVTALWARAGHLWVGDASGRVVAVDPSSGALSGGFVAHAGPVRRIFGPEPGRLVTIGGDGSVGLFSEDGAPLDRKRLPEARLNDAAVRPGGTFVGADQGIVAKLADDGTGWTRLGLNGKATFAVSLSPDGAYLASAGADGWIRLLTAATGEVDHDFDAKVPWVTQLRWQPDGLWSFGSDGLFTQWAVTAESHSHLRTIAGHAGPIVAVDLDADSILTGSEDGTARLWGRVDGKAGALFEAGAPVRAVALDRVAVYIGTADGRLRRFARETGTLERDYVLNEKGRQP
ncbi:MAG: WD40 repeat domain-containing protein [Bradymonadia bacterium]|jgi:WD40 repeat protein